jgi:peptidoglycan/LPS O-acetylase OafA/YrhL
MSPRSLPHLATTSWNGRLTRHYLATNLSCAFVAAVVAGILCAKLSPEPRTRYVLILAVIVLLLSLLSAVTDREHPSWYFAVIGVLAAAGILVGRVVVDRS